MISEHTFDEVTPAQRCFPETLRFGRTNICIRETRFHRNLHIALLPKRLERNHSPHASRFDVLLSMSVAVVVPKNSGAFQPAFAPLKKSWQFRSLPVGAIIAATRCPHGADSAALLRRRMTWLLVL
ncbi:hypothetical protein ACFUCQ_36060 [Streptomyces sp. NPDC057197]|uniref:hypothetical protein n=1 Tax=Streptomyces sp. NPDC057197 TaxID=3346045 RepID=UPI00363BD4F8